MRKVLIIFLLFVSYQLSATNYYFSTLSGASDANSGLTQTTPKTSISAMQVIITAAVSGDVIYLEAGSVWYESIFTITSKNITFSKYGTGDDPIISGSKIINKVETTPNLYWGVDASLPTTTTTRRRLGAVSVDWDYLRIGQEPDSGSYYLATSGSSSSLTDNTKSFATNGYTGGWLSLRRAGAANWLNPHGLISSNNATTFTLNGVFTDGQNANPNGTYVYYVIIGTKNVVTKHREWVNASDGLWLYWDDGIPGTLRASIIDNVFTITNSTVTFNEVNINSANLDLIVNTGLSGTLTFNDCVLKGAGRKIINNTNGGRIVIYRSDVGHSNAGIHNQAANGGAIIESNKITNIGIELLSNRLLADMEGGQSVLWRSCDDTLYLTNNYFDKVNMVLQQHYSYPAYSAMEMRGNFINTYGYICGDKGAVYTVNDLYFLKKRKIGNNFFLNSVSQTGALGNNLVTTIFTHALYFDEESYGFEVDSNTIVNANLAMRINQSRYVKFRYNNVVNASKDITNLTWATSLLNDSVVWVCGGTPHGSARDNTITYNTFVMDNVSGKFAWQYHACGKWWPTGYTQTNNKYVSKFASPDLFSKIISYTGGGYIENTLAEFQTATGLEASSSVYDMEYDSTRVFMNWSESSHLFDLGSGVYKDASGTTVSSTTTVRPMYSKVLFLINGNEAGRDELIYMDTTLVPFLDITPSMPQEAVAPDTLWFAYNDGGFSWEADTACGDTAIKGVYSAGTGTMDTLSYINFCSSTDQNHAAWVEVYDYPRSDSVQISTGVYIVMPTGLLLGSSGENPGYFNNNLVDPYYFYLPNTNNNPYTFRIRPLNPAYTYDIQLYPSRDNAGVTGTRKTYLTIGDSTKHVDAVGNVDSVIMIQNIDPVDSTITFYVDREDGGYGYMNAIVVRRTEKSGSQNNYIFFDNVDFSAGIDSAHVKIKHGEVADSLSMVMWLDSYAGTLLDSLVITAGQQCYVDTLTFTEISGTHDLYIELSDTAERYVWIKFFSDSGFSGVARITYIRVIVIDGIPYFISNKYAIKEDD
jgi:hypothetical protein